eukprot:CAMPEP_0116887136 /NCGR_PEP_ID=MMETSP0463-20121206/21378_1 /TAXON_ID=181622 /ORGANISM="Strombidinopsis sp, Strain SopsisLIS2011" /LENGTH=69 /DNA_ID=CAMNT_0004549039 /DNA_START=1019 /DNA_END=1229 /DNA_ORIENTATION=-
MDKQDEDFIQEAYVGYCYGSYYECGIAITKDKLNPPKTSSSQDVDMSDQTGTGQEEIKIQQDGPNVDLK